jgi:uncharacterized damage-inducible protein DinB
MADGGHLRTEPPGTGPAIELTQGFLGWLRETLLMKCAGLSEEQLWWSPVPSGTSLLGLVKHSIRVERYWITQIIGGLDAEVGEPDEDPDAEWRIEPGESFASIRDQYRAEWARSRDVLGRVSWDDVPPNPTGSTRPESVGWILTHMVEEVARHCGHADLIRELIDGQTGE